MATKEIVMEPQKTFKVQEDHPIAKEYHYMQRTVGVMATNDPIITGDQLDMSVME